MKTRCSDCKYWNHPIPQDEILGTCSISDLERSDGFVVKSEDNSGLLLTGPDFGCTRHEKETRG